MRSEDGLSITLKNGDILMTDNTKGNVYNDKKPIVNHLHKLMQELREKQAMEWVASANGSSAPAATKTADPVAQSAASSASAATAPAVPSGSEEAKSGAARMMLSGSGWIVAGAAALAAVVLG